ncbi:hypothetical protein Ancab_012692 [Ancistrocladus abbreviatus]
MGEERERERALGANKVRRRGEHMASTEEKEGEEKIEEGVRLANKEAGERKRKERGSRGMTR